MKKKIVLAAGFLPEGAIPYTGQYIYKVKAFREGAHGLGPDFPQPEWLEMELEGSGGIDGRLEKVKPVSSANPLDCRIHKYYLLEHEVWIKNLGDGKYVTDWTNAECWALAEARTCDDEGNVTETRELGFVIIHSDRRAGIVI
ncbi:MAG: hypothetical protein IKR51_08210 [Oscillospiraceae bacterium]|jgi:hypothetical protein|nr:hypothetical protein [Oscillospiraceae bacterium]